MPDSQESFKLIQNAVKDPNIIRIYSNGFATGIGNGDTVLVLQQNGIPVAILNLSFTVAKTLSIKLGNLIKDLEANSPNKIMTTDEIATLLQSMQERGQLPKEGL